VTARCGPTSAFAQRTSAPVAGIPQKYGDAFTTRPTRYGFFTTERRCGDWFPTCGSVRRWYRLREATACARRAGAHGWAVDGWWRWHGRRGCIPVLLWRPRPAPSHLRDEPPRSWAAPGTSSRAIAPDWWLTVQRCRATIDRDLRHMEAVEFDRRPRGGRRARSRPDALAGRTLATALTFDACGTTSGRRVRRAGARARYQQPAWRRLSDFVVARDGSCRECGSTRYLAAHDVIPRRDRGADHPANLIALCARCHARLEAERRRAS